MKNIFLIDFVDWFTKLIENWYINLFLIQTDKNGCVKLKNLNYGKHNN